LPVAGYRPDGVFLAPHRTSPRSGARRTPTRSTFTSRRRQRAAASSSTRPS